MKGRIANRQTSLGTRAVVLACALSGSVVVYARTALAEDDSSSDTAAARALAVEGMKLADAGRCPEAIDKLYRAEKLHHSAIVLAKLGECQVSEGRIVDGTEALRRVLREPAPANAPLTLTRTRERAQTVLDSAKPKIAGLTINVTGTKENVSVSIDGQTVAGVLLGSERPTDPGQHVIEVSAPGFLKVMRRVGLGPGERQALAVELAPDPQAPAAAEPGAPSQAAQGAAQPEAAAPRSDSEEGKSSRAAPSSEGAPSRTGAYVALGAGAAALVTGGVFGVLAMKDKSDLDKTCPNNVCTTSSAQSQLDSAKSKGTVSTVLVGAGLAGVALGTILYFVAGSSSEAPRQGLQARPWIGLGSAGLSGQF